MYMTYKEFENMVDNLVKEYDGKCECILDFLHSEDIDREIVEKINPLHIVRMIHECNENDDIYGWKDKFTFRFNILLGLCEMVEFVNRPNPKFKYNDIVWNKKSHEVFFVIDNYKDDDYYCLDDVNGNGVCENREFLESNFEKIGEVTKDVVNRLLNRN